MTQQEAAPIEPIALSSDVQQSLDYCRDISRRRAKNFYYGMRLTPEPKRSAIYAVYAFMRACDDLVDEELGDAVVTDERTGSYDPQRIAAAEQHVDTFRAQMDQALTQTDVNALPSDPVWPAFRYVMGAYPIDPAHLHAMLDGQRMDLTQSTYETFDDLYRYCYNVASTVGLVCVSVWGQAHEPVPGEVRETVGQLAEYRGIALQLTNILRDVVEDAQRGRVYLPQEDLERFNLEMSDLVKPRDAQHLERFERFMRFQIERARGYYNLSSRLERGLDERCRSTCWAIMEIYRTLLDRISARPTRVLTQRVRLSGHHKALIGLRAGLGRAWLR